MSDTRTVRLGDIAKFQAGISFPKHLQGKKFGEVPFAKVSDISRTSKNGNIYIDTTNNFVDSEEIECLKGRTVPEGSILFAKIGEAIRLNHRVITRREMYIDNNAMAILPDLSIVDLQFLFWTIKDIDFYKISSSTTVPSIRKSEIEKLTIDLPSLETQKKIAKIRNLQHTINQKRERQQELYTELERSLFISLFENPETWANKFEMTTIGDLAESTQYGTSAKAGSTGEYPVLRMGNITDDGKLDLSDLKYMDLSPEEVEKYTVRKGDLLFNRTNSKEKVGKAAVVLTDEKLAYAGYLVRVRFKNPDHAHFVAAFLNSDYGRKLRRKLAKTAVNQANINAKELTKIPIIEPENAKIINFNNFFTL